MKKIFTVLIALSLLAALCLSVSAKEIRFDIADANEEPYIYDKTETGDDQQNMGVPARFADAARYWIYKVTFDSADNYAFMSMNLGNDFSCEVSLDDKKYEVVLADENNTHDQGNLKRYNIDLSKYLKDNPTKTIYVQFLDNTTEDGWGPYSFGEVTFYSSDKEFTVTQPSVDKSVKAAENLLEYTSLAVAAPAEETPVEAAPAEETPAANDAPPVEAAPAPATSAPKTGDDAIVYVFGALLAVSAIITAAKRRRAQ